LDQQSGTDLPSLAPICSSGIVEQASADMTQTLEIQQAGALQHQLAVVCNKLPGKDSNLDKEYQKLLCYRYTTG
jgi:hypothetical protein